MTTIARSAAAVLVLAAGTSFAAGASGRAAVARHRASCRTGCDVAVADCVHLGFRERFCRREVVALCERGASVCEEGAALPCATISTSTTLASTTTTTMPPAASRCLGAPACAQQPTGIAATVGSAAELQHRLLGAWYDCKSSSSAPFGGDAAGIEFTNDGSWFFLQLADGGFLERDSSFGRAGTYHIIDTSTMNGPGHFQLDLERNTGGRYVVHWSLARDPQLLRIENMGVQDAIYAHLPGGPACAP